MNYLRSKISKKHRNHAGVSSTNATSTAAIGSNQSANGLSIEYFQMQLLLDCLMRVEYNAADHQELVDMCTEQISDNRNELAMMSEFKQTYSSDRALWWYLQESFLYKILNYSLESQDLSNLFLCRKILRDIQRQMQRHRSTTPLHVYRSQLMSNELINQWICADGQCVVVNSFLSATIDSKVALSFLNAKQTIKEDYCPVLLEIDADPRIHGTKPFVQVNSLRYSGDENEVIFMFGSVFLINNITCTEDNLYKIEMTLYSDNEHEFKQVFDDMKKKYGDGEINLLTFAQLLYDLDRFDEAEEYADRYREKLSSDHENLLMCYNLLGSITLAKKDFEKSLMYYNRALEFQMRRSLESNDLKIGDIHENIGNVYWKQGNLK